MVDVSSKIKAVRLSAGLTQSEFAEKINVSRASCVLWETGKRSPGKEVCFKIAETFGIDLNYLLGYEKSNSNSNCVQIALFADGEMSDDYIYLPLAFSKGHNYYAEMKTDGNCIIIYKCNSKDVAFTIQRIIN